MASLCLRSSLFQFTLIKRNPNSEQVAHPSYRARSFPEGMHLTDMVHVFPCCLKWWTRPHKLEKYRSLCTYSNIAY